MRKLQELITKFYREHIFGEWEVKNRNKTWRKETPCRCALPEKFKQTSESSGDTIIPHKKSNFEFKINYFLCKFYIEDMWSFWL